MEGLGHQLSAARNARNLSIDEVAAHIHMRPEYILALEEERWNDIGDPVYVRGFLRTYAHFLDLSAEKFISEYRSVAPDGIKLLGPQSPDEVAVATAKRAGSSLAALVAVAAVMICGGVGIAAYATHAGPAHAAVASAVATSLPESAAAAAPAVSSSPDARISPKAMVGDSAAPGPLSSINANAAEPAERKSGARQQADRATLAAGDANDVRASNRRERSERMSKSSEEQSLIHRGVASQHNSADIPPWRMTPPKHLLQAPVTPTPHRLSAPMVSASYMPNGNVSPAPNVEQSAEPFAHGSPIPVQHVPLMQPTANARRSPAGGQNSSASLDSTIHANAGAAEAYGRVALLPALRLTELPAEAEAGVNGSEFAPAAADSPTPRNDDIE